MHKYNSKPGYIGEMLLFMVTAIGMVMLFKIVLNNYELIKFKENADQISGYVAELKSLGRENDYIIDNTNKIIINAFNKLSYSDITCNNIEDFGHIVSINVKTEDSKINSDYTIYNKYSEDSVYCEIVLKYK